MRYRLSIVLICVAALAITGISGGCLRRPQRRPLQQEPTISLYVAETGQKTSMPMERYLEGVVAAEVGADAPPEALAAQAIIARTFTIQRIQEMGGTRQLRGTDASTNKDEFQAYDAKKVNEAVRTAVRNTRGMIITYNGQPALTWFHANSGGATATPQEGLNFTQRQIPYLTSVQDTLASPEPWQLSITTTEFANAVRRLGRQIGQVTNVSIGRRGPSGRAVEILVNNQAVPAPELRTQIGADKMRSTLLDSIGVSGGRVVMRGRGWGHGVGMSQDGARTLAQQGRRAADIIQHYYRGVQIERRWQ